MAAGFVWSLTILAESSSSLLYSAGRVIAWTIFPLLFYLILAYPEGRIRLRRDRLLAASLTAVVAVLFIGSALLVDEYPKPSPWQTCHDACPSNAFQLVSSEPPWVASLLGPARDLLAGLLLIGVTAVLAVRLRTASVIGRVTTAPVVAVSIVVTVVLIGFILTRRVAPDSELARDIGLAWTLCLPAIAAAFSMGLVQRRLLVSSVLSRMSRSLRTSLEPADIGAALRSTLGGPVVEVLVRDHGRKQWIREDGLVADAGRRARSGPDASGDPRRLGADRRDRDGRRPRRGRGARRRHRVARGGGAAGGPAEGRPRAVAQRPRRLPQAHRDRGRRRASPHRARPARWRPAASHRPAHASVAGGGSPPRGP